MQLNLSKDKTKITAETRDGTRLLGRVTSTFKDDGHFTEAANALGVPKLRLLELIDSFEQSEDTKRTVPLDASSADFTVFSRGLRDTEAVAHTAPSALEAFNLALSAPTDAVEPLILWEGTDLLCALDVDYHASPYDERPSLPALNKMIEQTEPRPCLAWSTHGRGLRLIYKAGSGTTAEELAGAAALHLAGRAPEATFELKCITRNPMYALPNGRLCGPVRTMIQTEGMPAIAAWLGRNEVDPEVIADYLEQNGMVVRGEYDHDKCPARPAHVSKNQPVKVYDNGIFCHSCSGGGYQKGHATPGWFPFTSLLGSPIPTQLRGCVTNLTHWDHARFVVAESLPNLSNAVAKVAYSAALKMKHPNDPRVPMVFIAGKDLIRFEAWWANNLGQPMTKDIRPILATLPACQYVNTDGKVAASMDRVARFDQNVSLREHGYPALSPIWGCRIFSHHLPLRDQEQVPVVLQTTPYQPDSLSDFRPRYIDPADRTMDEEGAWAVLETVFPRINRNAVTLMVAAKGVLEGDVGLPPMVFIEGPAQAAKTATVLVAAAISGDVVSDGVWSGSVEKIHQSVKAAKAKGSYVQFNEIVKDLRNAGKYARGSLEFVLNLTEDSLSHKLYVGQVPMGRLPVLTFTDTLLPLEIKQHTQLARRMIYVRLPEKMEWEVPIRNAGIGKPSRLRFADPRLADACNILLSCIIDRFFKYPMTFNEIADELGFSRLENHSEMKEKHHTLKKLFRAVCDAPALTGSDAIRWKGRGWKLILRFNQADPLADLWSQLADDDGLTSERCTETDWAKLLGVKGPVLIETRNHTSSKIAIRFVRRKSRTEYEVNEELGVKHEVELATEPGNDGFAGLGDTIDRELNRGRRQVVPTTQYDPPPEPGS